MQIESSISSNIQLEEVHVDHVYEVIANHFSNTRYKQWPHVAEFLDTFPENAFIADVGCGNGKYAHTNKHVIMFGSDMYVN